MDNKKIDQIYDLLSRYTGWEYNGFPINEIKKQILPDESIESIRLMINNLRSENLVLEKKNHMTAYSEGYILSPLARMINDKYKPDSITEYLQDRKAAISLSSKKVKSKQTRAKTIRVVMRSIKIIVSITTIALGIIGLYFSNPDLFIKWLTFLGLIK